MITLIVVALIVAGIIYLAFFGIFKLIWLLCKSHRNFWPLVLAGVGTVLFGGMVTWGMWWSAQKLITPFKQMMVHAKENPEPVFGPRVYQDERFPFELTVFDGMDFSKWISFKDLHIKIGIDTNAFKKEEAATSSPLTILLIRTPIEDKNEPFAQWHHFKDQPNTRMYFQIMREEETTVNGMQAYQVDGVAHSNHGPAEVWMTLLNDGDKALYYLIIMELGEEDKTSQIETIRNSFKRTGLAIATPSAEEISSQETADLSDTQTPSLPPPVTLADPQPAQ